MKILLIEQEPRVIEILINALRTQYNAEVELVPESSQLEEKLAQTPPPDLIIVRNLFGEDPIAKKTINWLYDHEKTIGVIVLGEVELAGMKYETLPTKFRVELLYKKISNLLELSKSDIKEMTLPDFIPIPINYLFTMQRSSCDIFVKIKKQLEDSYIKRINANEEFDKEGIIRYHEKYNLQELYVKKEDRLSFFNELIEQAVSKLESPSVTIDEKISIAADFFETNLDEILENGIDEFSVRMVNASVKNMTATITSTGKLGDLLKGLLASKGSYAFKRANLLSMFSLNVLPSVDLGPINQLQGVFEKLVFIAFFKDLHLKDFPELHKINSKEDFESVTMTEEAKQKVITHANQVATLVQQFPKAPLGVDVIIRQHHGVSNGMGFPTNYGASISPLAIIVIVIEAFVIELLEMKTKGKKLQTILEELDAKFTLPSYKKVLNGLKLSLTKNF